MLPHTTCRHRKDLDSLLGDDVWRRRFALEVFIAWRHRDDSEGFVLPAFCLLDDRPVDLEVTWAFASPPLEMEWLTPDAGSQLVTLPNWRETLVCPDCRLNNRQRAVAAEAIRLARETRAAEIYLSEQISPLFALMRSRLPGAHVTGSEYLGPELAGGTVRDGIRHEDAESLSFDDASLDLVVSCSVLEHVPRPYAAVAEIARVLRPGGLLLLEVPFDHRADHDVQRARPDLGSGIEHVLPPVYHGDPLSSDGVLVYTDFGWGLLDRMEGSGYFTCELVAYWSLELGHLGGIQHFFRASRTHRSWHGPRSLATET